MAADSELRVNRGVLAGGALLLVALGAGGAYFVLGRGQAPQPAMPQAVGQPAAPAVPSPEVARAANESPLPDVTVTLSEDAARRAGIVVTPVGSSKGAAGSL